MAHPPAVTSVAPLQYSRGVDFVHPLSEGADIGHPRPSRKAGKARGSAEQRPAAATGKLAKSSLRVRLDQVRLLPDSDRIVGGSVGPGRATTGNRREMHMGGVGQMSS